MAATILIAGTGLLPAAIEQRLAALGARTHRLGELHPDALETSVLEEAAALVLTADDDSGNIDLALLARRLKPGIRLVLRVFDAGLARYVRESVPGAAVLSVSSLAAPVMAQAARKLLVERPQVDRSRGAPPLPAPRRFSVDRILLWALLLLFALVFPSALFFSHALGLRYMDALYFVWTTVMTVGYGDIALKDAGDGVKLYGMALMLAGAAFIAVLFALLSDFVMSRRLAMLRGHTRERGRGHVVIVGAGNVGFRTAEMLAGDGHRLVVVDRAHATRNVAHLAAAGHHIIVGDAASEEILQLAGLERSALVLAATDADGINLRVALLCRQHGVPVILRIQSPELSAHISARGDGIAFSPIAAAAAQFAAAALGS